MINPKCYNRPAVQPGAWMLHSSPIGGKPRYRWVPAFYVDRCVTWDGVGIGPRTPEWPNGEPYPVAHGWDCTGCQWVPMIFMERGCAYGKSETMQIDFAPGKYIGGVA